MLSCRLLVFQNNLLSLDATSPEAKGLKLNKIEEWLPKADFYAILEEAQDRKAALCFLYGTVIRRTRRRDQRLHALPFPALCDAGPSDNGRFD